MEWRRRRRRRGKTLQPYDRLPSSPVPLEEETHVVLQKSSEQTNHLGLEFPSVKTLVKVCTSLQRAMILLKTSRFAATSSQ